MLAGNTEGSTKFKNTHTHTHTHTHTNYYIESQQIKRDGFLYAEKTNG